MKELKKEDLQITELIHRFVREHVEAGDICIDATAGCGNDTLFLCELTGARGEVMAFDIQPQALEKTATLLAEHECMAELVLDSHSNMADYMSEERGKRSYFRNVKGARLKDIPCYNKLLL